MPGANGLLRGSSSAAVTLNTGERRRLCVDAGVASDGATLELAMAVRSEELFLAAKKPRWPTEEEPRL